MNRAKIKGTNAETAFVNYLREAGWPNAERRALQGNKDMGDTTGHPGLVFEVKACATWKIPQWLRELKAEVTNANAQFGILVIKAPSMGAKSVGRWAAVMPSEWYQFLKFAVRSDSIPRLNSPAHYDYDMIHVWMKYAAAGDYLHAKMLQSTDTYCLTKLDTVITALRDIGYGTPAAA